MHAVVGATGVASDRLIIIDSFIFRETIIILVRLLTKAGLVRWRFFLPGPWVGWLSPWTLIALE